MGDVLAETGVAANEGAIGVFKVGVKGAVVKAMQGDVAHVFVSVKLVLGAVAVVDVPVDYKDAVGNVIFD